MWYTFRRGSGIFYRLGRSLARPGKTAMAAALLRELATHKKLAVAWSGLAQRDNLFTESGSQSNRNAWADAERLQAIANGTMSCAQGRVQPCRCRYVLHDHWDNAIVWMARVLQYETLIFTATLLCNQPQGMAPASATPPAASPPSTTTSGRVGVARGANGFTTAYPELVDVRPFEDSMADRQLRGEHATYLQLRDGGELRAARKRPEIAEAWVRKIRVANVLTLRDPLRLAQDEAAVPCRFSDEHSTLQCAGHVSEAMGTSSWSKCGLAGCGYIHGGARAMSLIASRQTKGFRNASAAV